MAHPPCACRRAVRPGWPRAFLALLLAGATLLAADPPELSRSELLARMARGAVARRDWNTALDRFQEALDLAPRDAVLRKEFAGVLFQAGNARRALEEYDRVLDQRPGDREAQDAGIDLCMAVHDFDSMLQRLVHYRPERETDRRFMLKLARGYLWTHQPAQAVRLLDALLRDAPDDRDLNKEYLIALLAAQMWDEFAARSEPFLVKWPDDEQVRLFRVDALLLQDRAVEALALLRDLTRDPAKASASVLLRAVDLRMACGEPTADVRAWLEAITRDRRLPELRLQVAILYAYDGAFHSAWTQVDAARREGASAALLAGIEAELYSIGQMPRTATERFAALLQAEQPGVRALKGAAQAALALRKLDVAKSLLRRAVIQFPGDMDATFRYARLLEERGETAEGLSLLNAVVAAHPQNPAARLLRGRAFLAAGQSERAAEDLDAVSLFLAEHGVAGAVASGLFPAPYLELIPSFVWRAVCTLSPKDAPLRAQLALALQREGRIPQAADQWEEIVRALPEARWRLHLVETLLAQGIATDAARRDRVQAEIATLVGAVDLDRPGLARLAEVLVRLENWEALLRVADRLLQAQSDDGYAVALAGSALMGLHRDAEAQALFERYRALAPENLLSEFALWSRLGYCGRQKEHPAYRKAMAFLTALAERQPENLDLRQAAGELAATHGEFDAGRGHFGAVNGADAADPIALLWRARLEAWDRRYDEALRLYTLYEEADPADRKVKLERARALGWALHYSEARREYNAGIERLQQQAPVDPNAEAWAKAAALERDAKSANWARRERTAIGCYDQLLTFRPDDPEILFERGQMATRLGFSKQAEDHYDRALLLLDDRTLAHNFVRDAIDFEQTRRHATLIQSYDFRRENGFSDLFEITEHLLTTTAWSPEIDGMFWLGAEVQEGFYTFQSFPGLTAERLRFMARKRFDNGLQLDAWVRGGYYWKVDNATFNGALEARYKAWDRLETLLGIDRLDVLENYRTIAQEIEADRIRLALGGDIAARWRADGQIAYVHYEDGNNGLRGRAALGYELLRYPRMLKLIYGLDYWNFQHDDRVYFSPRNYVQHGPMLHWRHYLNEQHYAGVNELYYGIKIPLGFDSNGKVYFGGGVEFLWDITHHWQVGAEANATWSQPYEGYFGRAWVQYRF